MTVAWTLDVPQGHDLFLAIQMPVVWGAISMQSGRYRSLALEPEAPLALDEAMALVDAGLALTRGTPGVREAKGSAPATQATATRDDVERLLRADGLLVPVVADPPRWGEVAAVFAPLIERALEQG